MPAPNVTSVQGANLLKKSGSEAVLNVPHFRNSFILS